MLFSSFIRKSSKFLRTLLLGQYRQNRISIEIANLITNSCKKKKLRILDYGSGYFKPTIAELVGDLLTQAGIKAKFICVDLYTKKDIENLNASTNLNIKNYNINYLDKNNIGKFDFCIISDVLHHCSGGFHGHKKNELLIGSDNPKLIINLLRKIKNKSKNIIIKDHYERNLLDRFLLRILDFMGNYHNFTILPKKYFTKVLFYSILKMANLRVVKKIYNKKYYPDYFLFFANKNLHFIYLLK